MKQKTDWESKWNNLHNRHARCPLGCTAKTCRIGESGEEQEIIDFIQKEKDKSYKEGWQRGFNAAELLK